MEIGICAERMKEKLWSTKDAREVKWAGVQCLCGDARATVCHYTSRCTSTHRIPIFRTVTLDPLAASRQSSSAALPQHRRRHQRLPLPCQWKSFNLMNANELKNCKRLLIRFRRAVKCSACAQAYSTAHTFCSLVFAFFSRVRIFPIAVKFPNLWNVLRLSYFAFARITIHVAELLKHTHTPHTQARYSPPYMNTHTHMHGRSTARHHRPCMNVLCRTHQRSARHTVYKCV